MEEYLIKSTAIPSLFVRELLPTSYPITPVHWGDREQAKPLSYDRAVQINAELLYNGIETEIIRNGDLVNGRTGIKLQ